MVPVVPWWFNRLSARWAFFKDDGSRRNDQRLEPPLSSTGAAVERRLIGVVGPGVSEIPVLTA